MEQELNLPGPKDLKEVPINQSLKALIVDVQVKTWREILGAEKLLEQQAKGNFEDGEAKSIIVKYDAKGFIREEKFPYHPEPTTRSKYGKFVVRYNSAPKPGLEITVDFDQDGKSTILIAK